MAVAVKMKAAKSVAIKILFNIESLSLESSKGALSLSSAP